MSDTTMDPAAVLEWVDVIDKCMASYDTKTDVIQLPVVEYRFLRDQLRLAIADTRRVKWLRNNVCEIVTRSSDGFERSYDDDGEGDNGIIDTIDELIAIDAAMAATPRET